MKQFKRLSHSIYECKYHFVLLSFAEIEEYRYQIFKDDIAEYTRQQIYQLCKQKELVEVLELNVKPDHIHLVMDIPPKYRVSEVMGYLKGKLALMHHHYIKPIFQRLYSNYLWVGCKSDYFLKTRVPK